MATYKQIFGKQIKFLSSDPANEAEGQIWYNSTAGAFKSVVASEAWASGAPIATARSAMAGGGIPTAAWIAGGKTNNAPTNTTTAATEEYNGSGWSTGGTLPQGSRSFGEGAGPLTAGITVGGGPTSPLVGQTWVESYNGTSWTAETGTPLGLVHNSVFGLESAAVSAGRGPGTATPQVFNFDGSTWTVGGTMSLPRGYTTSAGTQTAGWIAGGWDDGGPPFDADEHEQYDGTSWTDGPVLNTGRSAGGGNGPQTSAIYFGGIVTPTSTTATETFDGSSWSTSPATLGTAVDEMGSANNGTSNSTALSVGGLVNNAHPQQDATQEYNKSANVITAGAWGSAPIMNTARSALGGARNGTQTSCLAFSGYEGSPAGIKTEEFDGSSWANKNSMGTGRYNTPGTGIVTAALAAGGNAPPQSSSTEEFDGTNWAANPTGLNTARYMGPLTGTQTAALFSGGTDTSSTMITATETYNGSAWTTSPATLNTGRAAYNAGAGTQTASVIWSGYATPPGFSNASEEFNGTSWTAGNNYLLSAKGVTGAGTLAAAWSASGKAPGNSSAGFSYDGTNWSTAPSLGAAKYNCAGGGASGAGIIFAGTTGVPLLNTTEEFTAETSTLNYQTITTS